MLGCWLCSSSAPGVSLHFGFEKLLGDDREKLLSPLLYSNRTVSQELLSEEVPTYRVYSPECRERLSEKWPECGVSSTFRGPQDKNRSSLAPICPPVKLRFGDYRDF